MSRKTIEIIDSREKLNTKVILDLKEIELMSGMGLTQENIAHIKGIAPETFSRNKKQYITLDQAIVSGKSKDLHRLLTRLRDLSKAKTTPPGVQLTAIKILLNILHGLNEKTSIDHTTKGEKMQIEKTSFIILGKEDKLPDEFRVLKKEELIDDQ